MAKYALCMGVDDFSQWTGASNLPYSVKSAEDVADLLINSFEFPAANVSVMRNSWCTKGNILQAINNLLHTAQAGDVVCVYYSGHGTRIRGVAPGGQPENDTWYEAFLPYSGNLITDHELGVLADQLEYDHVNFTLILDTCHSGGLPSIEGIQPVGVRLPETMNQLFIQACHTLVPVGLCLENPRSDVAGNVRTIRFENDHIVIEADDESHFVNRAKSTVISACRNDEFGWHVPAIQNTILVGAFKNVVNMSPYVDTYAGLIEHLRAAADGLMTQHVRTYASYANMTSVPQLYGQRARVRENFLAPWTFSING